MIIGINLSSSAFETVTVTTLDSWIAFATIITTLLVNVYAPAVFQRLSILVGMIFGYLINAIVGWTGDAPEIDFTKVIESPWFEVPLFISPRFEAKTISIIAPVCIVLVAENLGHVKAVGATVEKCLDKYLGRAIVGDAIATIVSSSGGGQGTTTLAQNIGVMVKCGLNVEASQSFYLNRLSLRTTQHLSLWSLLLLQYF